MYRLLIVDDESIIRTAISRRPIWKEIGFSEVDTADSVAEARVKLTTFAPDVVFTDLVMPHADGFELMRYVRDKHPAVRVVVLSGYNEFEYAVRAMRLGACAYVLKPTDDNELRIVFTEVLRREKQSPETLGGTSYGALDMVLSYIHERYASRLTLEECAAMMGMNPSYFSTYFSKMRGMKFVDYVNGVRVEKAKALLRESNLRIYEVSDAVGFNEMSYFCRVFRKITGRSPAAYRNGT